MPLSLSRFPTSSLPPLSLLSAPSNGTDTVHWQGFTKSNFFMRAFKISSERERERGGFLGHFLLFYFFSRFYGAIETISSGLEYEKDGNEAFNGSSRFNYRNEWTITSISNFRWKFVILYEVFTDLYRAFLPRNWNFDLYLFSILPEKWDCVERILRMIMFTQSHVDISWKKLSIEYF